MKPNQEETPYILGSCLRGPPKDWWDLVKEDNDTLESFCNKFKSRFWNENTQHEVKCKLEFGHFASSGETSMTNYALKSFRDAKGLTPPLSDPEIIRKLSRHFNEEIRTAILGRQLHTLQGLLELLERFDTSGPINKKNDTPDQKIDNWRVRPGKTEAEKQGGPRKEENWRNRDRNQTPYTRNVRTINTAEEKGEDKEEEVNSTVAVSDPEN